MHSNKSGDEDVTTGRKFIIFDGHLSASTERILKCYLTQESIVDGRETEGPRRGVGDRRD